MNLSGKAVKYWVEKLKINKENILVVLDDISLPYGKSKDNLPLGIQLLSKHFNEQTLFNAAHYLEKNN